MAGGEGQREPQAQVRDAGLPLPHSLQASPRKENSRRDDVSEEAEDLGLQLNPGLQGPGDEGPENV